jgi:hypothetical protein
LLHVGGTGSVVRKELLELHETLWERKVFHRVSEEFFFQSRTNSKPRR